MIDTILHILKFSFIHFMFVFESPEECSLSLAPAYTICIMIYVFFALLYSSEARKLMKAVEINYKRLYFKT